MQRASKGTNSVRPPTRAGAPEASLPPAGVPLRDRGEPGWWRPSDATSPRCRRAADGHRRERHRDAERPRPPGSWLTRWVDRIVSGVFRLATRNIPGLQAPGWVLAEHAAAIPIAQLAAWVVRVDLGAEAASLLASWLVMPPHRRGQTDLLPPGQLPTQCHRSRRRAVRVANVFGIATTSAGRNVLLNRQLTASTDPRASARNCCSA